MESSVVVESSETEYIDPNFDKCSNCGFEIPKGVTYCWRCGTRKEER